MLAYVFWHWRNERCATAEYEAALASFHEELFKRAPVGFQSSFVFRSRGAPWTAPGGDFYEDWYLLDNSAALDVLNESAVTGSCEAPHTRVARMAAGGTGGLYRRRMGAPAPDQTRFAVWFSKPPGMSYAELDGDLADLTGLAGATVWCRQMTLGPAAEFCLHSAFGAELSAGWSPMVFPLHRVWP